MTIDFDLFLNWTKDNFGEENIKIKSTPHGDEICINSFLAEAKGITDDKNHLWMSPSGGKKGNKDYGAYRCWYTNQYGTLVGLVSRWESVPWEQAEEMICETSSLRILEQKLHEFFGHKEEIVPEVEPEPIIDDVPFPDFCHKIDNMSESNHWFVNAFRYLDSRKLPTNNLYVCSGGKYKNRIVIPYFDRQGKLLFYNCRTMDKYCKLRYMKSEEGDQDNCLYFYEWPHFGEKIYIVEGELDAISLNIAGLNGCACGGKFLSESQIEIIRHNGYEPVLAFDADIAGAQAITDIGENLLEKGFVDTNYIRPPKIYKDWNNMLQKRGPDTIKAYINRFEKPYTVDTLAHFQLNQNHLAV